MNETPRFSRYIIGDKDFNQAEQIVRSFANLGPRINFQSLDPTVNLQKQDVQASSIDFIVAVLDSRHEQKGVFLQNVRSSLKVGGIVCIYEAIAESETS